jgi:hypothetical protein
VPQIHVTDKYRASVKAIVQAVVTCDITAAEKTCTPTVAEGLTSEDGRTCFAEALLAEREKSKEVGRLVRLKTEAVAFLAGLLQIALERAAEANDSFTPQLFVEVSESFYHIVDGASTFVTTHLQGLAIWQRPTFWEEYFFFKAGEIVQQLYEPSLDQALKAWPKKTKEEQTQIEQDEQEALWKLLAAFAFKMCSLVVLPDTVRRFATKMCNKLCLDDAHRKTLLQVVSNMVKMNQQGSDRDDLP